MFIPYRTDAPVYHTPFATAGVIALAAGLSLATWYAGLDPEPLMLQYDVVRPHQWVTSNFLHGGWSHLLGNAMFLWIFGQIVEGKVGAWRFLAIFLGIGVSQCCVEQLLFTDGASLGASSIVFGLMGISLVWAPENEVTWAWWFWFRVGTFESRVSTAAIFYTVWELFWVGLTFLVNGFTVTSGVLHLMGLAVGLPLGVWMLRSGRVNCEGWDWFSVRRGDHRRGLVRTAGRVGERRAPETTQLRAASDGRRLARFRGSLAARDSAQAGALARELRSLLGEEDVRRLADLYYEEGQWTAAAAMLSEHRRRFTDPPVRSSLRLAEIAIRHQVRPTAALGLLATIPRGRMTDGEARQYAELVAEGRRVAAENPLELADDTL